jgi:protease-4
LTQEKLVAGALVLFCAVAAVGSWFAGRPAEPAGKESAFGRDVFGKAEIAQLDVQGMIVDSGRPGGFGGGGGTTSAQSMLAAIARVREDKVPVVLLNINSPGGTASASQAIFDELQRLKKDQGTHVVATMGDLAASGGYYIASAADVIVANPSTLTGSIGVIMHNQNLQGLMGKIGVQNSVIKSGAHKDIMSPYRPITPDERVLLQGIVDDTYDQFLTAVSTGRKLTVAQVRPLADGRIFTGRQAQKVKLVDVLGNYNVAVDQARKLGKLGADAEPKDYSGENWRSIFGAMFSETTANPVGQMLSSRAMLLQSGAFDKVPLTLYE